MHWYCRVHDDSGDWTAYCVYAKSEYRATSKLHVYLTDVEGFDAIEITEVYLEPWDTFSHGDINTYEIIS